MHQIQNSLITNYMIFDNFIRIWFGTLLITFQIERYTTSTYGLTGLVWDHKKRFTPFLVDTQCEFCMPFTLTTFNYGCCSMIKLPMSSSPTCDIVTFGITTLSVSKNYIEFCIIGESSDIILILTLTMLWYFFV